VTPRHALASTLLLVLAACSGGAFEVPEPTDATSDVTVDAAADTSPDAPADTTADAKTDAKADAKPDALPDALPDVLPDVIVVDVGPDAVASCTWGAASACAAGFFCDAPGCGAGTCKPIPTTEGNTRNAVCGCDNVVYWNPSVAAAHGMSVAANGECATPKGCGGIASIKCPPDTFCNNRQKDSTTCNVSDSAGVCWGIPKTCPAIVVGNTSHVCGSSTCKDECIVIRSGERWYTDPGGCPM
jgi:hypothetical protein